MLLGSLFHGSNLLWDFDSFFLEDRVALGSGFFYPWLKDQQLVLLSNFRSERQAACAHVITPQWRDDKLGNESMSLSASEASKRAFFPESFLLQQSVADVSSVLALCQAPREVLSIHYFI